MKIAFIADRGVFQLFCCPGKLFKIMVITLAFSISTGFILAHFEDRKYMKIRENLKSTVDQGQMSQIL